MAKQIRAKGTTEAEPELLRSIADSVRRSFQTAEDMAHSFIREAIHQGAFPPGQRLNLDTIAATLGVSRMPVRASLRKLESEGLLRIHSHRGVTVSVLSAEEISEIYELRILLESYLLERSIERIDDAVLDTLESILIEMEDEQDPGERLAKRRVFYELLYEQADRPRALGQVNHLRGSVGRYLLLQRVGEHRDHMDFMGYLRERDVDDAKAWLESHLTRVSQTLQEMVQADSGSEANTAE